MHYETPPSQTTGARANGRAMFPAENRWRRWAIVLCRSVLRLRASPYQPTPGGIALVIAPHPDDEVFGCAGLILRRRLSGHPVHVLYLTDGSASHPSHPTLAPTQLKMARAEEARAALKVLGADSARAHFLEARDGALDKLDEAEQRALVEKIEDVLRAVKPNEVFLPYRRDGSSEHEAAFRLLDAALSGISPRPRVFEFPIWSWWSPRLLLRLALTRARVARCSFSGYEAVKWQAICAYRSQTEPVAPWTDPVLPAGFAAAFRGAEEFFFEID